MQPEPHPARLFHRIALVAGVFSAIVCALLLYDYSLRRADNPSETLAYAALKGALKAEPNNQELVEQFRRLDARLRADYFRHQTFTTIGAVLLLTGVAVALIAARQAAVLQRRPPEPGPHRPPHDVETPLQRTARWATAGLAVVLAGLTVTLSLGQPKLGDWRQFSGEARGTRGEGEAASLAARPSQPATPYEAPSAAELAAAWPRFRGPEGSGVSTFSDAPVQWDVGSGEGIRWKTPVSLPGNSSPVVWQKHVFLTGATEQDRQVFAFDVDSGELLWQAAVPGTPQSTATVPEVLKETGYAAPTPVTDGRRVFAIFANGDLVAFDYQGQIAWSHSFGIPENVYGHASSLTMYHPGSTAGLPGSAGSAENAGQARPLNGDAGGTSLVIVQLDQGALGKDGLSRLYALSAADGSIVWQAERDVPNSWTSPIIINHDGQDQLITAADPWVIAYDPANGDELWRVDCLRSDCGPSPVYAGGLIQIGNEYCEWSALKPDGTGNITETAVQWTALDGLPDTCCPLAAEGLVFLMPSSGYFTCLDAATGEFLWEQDFTTGFTSSPSLVKTPESEKSPDSPGLVYLFTKRGKAIIGRPTRDGWETVSECSLGEGCVTSPAFQPGRMYIRGEKHLFCIEMQ